jgi:hypothetical protein
MNNFVKHVVNNGGKITPIVIPPEYTKGTGLFNPSVYFDGNNILLNLRHCQYTLYHAEKNIFEHEYGPLVYLNPENDITLTTTNYICTIDQNLTVNSFVKVDTSKFDVKPIWEFVGLEDCRIVKWYNKLYLSGVRRDTTPNGVGRMELSQIEIIDGKVYETSRFRIPAPGDNNSYCEKNWMPIVDLPYHYVKWCNPTEVVRVDQDRGVCETVYLSNNYVPKPFDFRGGSQVLPFGEHRIALTHTVNLYNSHAGRKNATYRHCFVVWDKNWNIIKYGDQFDFMSGEIEFCAGMCEYKGDYLITFGFQDNAAYLLHVPKKVMEDFIYG